MKKKNITKNASLSVVILTKNRYRLLACCLYSLTQQSILPDEVIIINNGSTDKTESIIAIFSKYLPIKHLNSTTNGFPNLYNLGIKSATKPLLSFLDDDCYAQKNWCKNILNAHSNNMNCIIQGMSYSYPMNNIFASIMGDHYKNWLEHNTVDGKLTVIDNKNVSGPTKIWKKFKFNSLAHQGAEDIELGKRFLLAKVPIFLKKDIAALHRERSTFNQFLTQHFRIAQSEKTIDNYLQNNKIGTFNKKAIKNCVSLLKRLKKHAKQLHFFNVLIELYLFLCLILIRILGYFILKKKVIKYV